MTNGGGGVLDSLFTTVRWDAGAPGWLAREFSTQTAPATLTLTPTSDTLPAGTYEATVAVASPLATNSPQQLSVSLWVQTRAVLLLGQDTTTFTGVQNGVDPAVQLIPITNGGESALTGLTASVVAYGGGQDGWLTPTLIGGTTAPTTLQLAAAIGTRTPDTLTAQVEVASPEAANGADTVDVTFIID